MVNWGCTIVSNELIESNKIYGHFVVSACLGLWFCPLASTSLLGFLASFHHNSIEGSGLKFFTVTPTTWDEFVPVCFIKLSAVKTEYISILCWQPWVPICLFLIELVLNSFEWLLGKETQNNKANHICCLCHWHCKGGITFLLLSRVCLLLSEKCINKHDCRWKMDENL